MGANKYGNLSGIPADPTKTFGAPSAALGKSGLSGMDDSNKSLYSVSRNKRGLKPGPKRIRQTVGKQVGKRSPTKR